MRARRPRKPAAPPAIERACDECGARFVANRTTNVYCSKGCSDAGRARKSNAAAKAKYGKRSPIYFVVCSQCGRLSTVRMAAANICRRRECKLSRNAQRMRENLHWTHTPAMKVVKERSARNYRARKNGARSDGYNRAEVFARDKWRCQLCGKRVDPAVKHPHPASASIDHILPLSKGGHDVESNVQLACLGCNSAKRDRAANDQLRLELQAS